jgi:hypothetical protein
MILTPAEKESAIWMKLSEEIEKRIEVYRTKNEGDLTAEQTAKLRGQIAFAREILGWAATPKTFTD